MTREEFVTLALQDYDAWHSTQDGQTDAYEYERSFDQMMTNLSNKLYQMSVGKVPSDHRKKNDSQPVWQN